MSKARARKRAHRAANNSSDDSVGSAPSASFKNSTFKTPHSTPWSAFSGQARWVCLALIAVNLFVYASVWHHDFVNYDDDEYVSANPVVLRGLTWQGVSWAFTTGHSGNWHPLTWLSHMVDIEFYGSDSGLHHFTNLLFHIVNTLLLFGLLRRMTGALGRSAFVAGLFAVHPLHVESVAWVAERKDVLSTFFWMLTIWAYVEYVRRRNLRRYSAVFILFALGLMAKQMLVTLPFVLLLLDFWPLGRIAAEPSSKLDSAPSRDGWAITVRLIHEKIPLLALSVVSSIVAFLVHQKGSAVISLTAIPLTLRVENALVSYAVYIAKMLWPARLAVFYPYAQSLPAWQVAGAFLFLLIVSVAVIRSARRYPYLPVGWFWYLGTLVPVIGLIQVGDQSLADRYTYIPLIGLFIIVAWGVPDLLARWPLPKFALPASAGLVILACAIVARSQVQYWRDSTTLWTHALAVTTGNNIAHNNLGASLAGQGEMDKAIAHYSEALRIKPDYADAHNNLGVALSDQGKLDEAIAHYSEALRIKPNYADADLNLGVALADQGKLDEAIAHFNEALRIKPDSAKAHNDLGVALATGGKLDEAIAQFTDALHIEPGFADARKNLDIALAKQGKK